MAEGEDEQAPRPKINWSDRFKRALDMNPGRTERLSRTEQELPKRVTPQMDAQLPNRARPRRLIEEPSCM